MTFSLWEHIDLFTLEEVVIAWTGLEPVGDAFQNYQRHLNFLKQAVASGKLKTQHTSWDDAVFSYKYKYVKGRETVVHRQPLREFFASIGEYPKFLFPEPPQNKEVIELKQRIAELEAAAQKDGPLSAKERHTLLTIIRVMAKMAKLDLSHPYADATTIAKQAQEMDVAIGETMIYAKLKEAKEIITKP